MMKFNELPFESQGLFQSDAEFIESSLAIMPTRCIEEDGLRGRSMQRPDTSVTSSKCLIPPAEDTITMGPPPPPGTSRYFVAPEKTSVN